MADKLLFDLKLLTTFASKLRSADYQKSIAQRKSIYPFIHNLTAYILEFTQNEQQMVPLVPPEAQLLARIQAKCPEDWRTLVDAFAESEELIGIEWGQMVIEPNPHKKKNEFTVKHNKMPAKESNLDVMLQSGASTNKRIVSNSLEARQNLLTYDDALQK